MAPRLLFQGRNGELRIMDGSNPPKYLSLPWVQMNLNISGIARPRTPDPVVPTVDGWAHLPDDSYEKGFYEPIPVSFSCWIDDTTNSWKLRQALSNPDLRVTWQVGTQTWTSAKGQGSPFVNADGTFSYTPNTYFDSQKVSVHMEVLWSYTQSGGAGTATFGVRLNDVFFPPQDQAIVEGSDAIEMTVKGLVYGMISSIGAFTSGGVAS